MMEQFAQSKFFYHNVAPNLDIICTMFWLGIFGLVGVVAMTIKTIIRER